MALARVKTWVPGEVLSAADLNGEVNNILNNPINLISPWTGNQDANSNTLSNVALSGLQQLTGTVTTIDLYDDFADLISTIGSAVTTVLINQNVNVTATATTNANTHLVFMGQGALTVSAATTTTLAGPTTVLSASTAFAGGGTLTINGPFFSTRLLSDTIAATVTVTWGASGLLPIHEPFIEADTDGTWIFNALVNEADSGQAVITGGGSSAQPNLIGSPTMPAGTDFTPTGWADDTGYVAASATQSVISAGGDNIVNQQASSITGGAHNFIKYNADGHSHIGSGVYNVISAGRSHIVGGRANTITGTGSFNCVLSGEDNNILNSQYSVIAGGEDCDVAGDYTFAFGFHCKPTGDGIVAFKDSAASNFSPTTANQFAARFANGFNMASAAGVKISQSDDFTAPTNLLHVLHQGGGVTDATLVKLELLGNAGDELGMEFHAPRSAASIRAGRIIAVGGAGGSADGYLGIQSMASGDTPVDTLFISKGNLGIGTVTFGTSAKHVLSLKTDTAPSDGPADTVQLYSSDNSAGNTIPSFFCEGTDVLATGQADSASSVRVKMRINGTVVTLLAI